MPNWCYQTVSVYGDNKEDLQFFLDTITEGEGYELNKLYPTPQELVDTIDGWTNDPEKQAANEAWYARNMEKYGHRSWYGWNCEHWGTKWGACDVQVNGDIQEMNDGSCLLVIVMESAWSPATGLLKFISGLFPTLLFTNIITEEGDSFAGVEAYHKGNIVLEQSVSTDMKLPDWDSDDYLDALNEAQEAIHLELDDIEGNFVAFMRVVTQ